MEKTIILPFPFPAVAVVAVMCGDHHDPAFVIENRPNVHVMSPLALTVVVVVIIVIIFPRHSIVPAGRIQASDALLDIWGLKLVLRALQVENTVKERVLHRELAEFTFWQN